MAQKTNPTALRLGIKNTWKSRWIVRKREYPSILYRDLETKHYTNLLLSSMGINVDNLNLKTQNKILFIYMKKISEWWNQGKTPLRKGTFKKFTPRTNSVLNIQENHAIESRNPTWKRRLRFRFIPAKTFSEYISQQLSLPVGGRNDLFKKGFHIGILSLMRYYYTGQNKRLISGIKICCKGKWMKTATGRSQKLVLTLGKLNTQTFNTIVDYSLSTAATKFGTCSVKVMVSFRTL